MEGNRSILFPGKSGGGIERYDAFAPAFEFPNQLAGRCRFLALEPTGPLQEFTESEAFGDGVFTGTKHGSVNGDAVADIFGGTLDVDFIASVDLERGKGPRPVCRTSIQNHPALVALPAVDLHPARICRRLDSARHGEHVRQHPLAIQFEPCRSDNFTANNNLRSNGGHEDGVAAFQRDILRLVPSHQIFIEVDIRNNILPAHDSDLPH
ncbi:MAG: hypothetical protein BWY66_01066 [bacterium ADurb.Bin374]|nr:MAG: hypothetical protein BWY66_01066 [bacterium ADurb.Bin374]